MQIKTRNHHILISPFILNEKIPANFNFDKIEMLHLYEMKKNEEYFSQLEKLQVNVKSLSEKTYINYGQDFNKDYLGSFQVDLNEKKLLNWMGKSTLLGLTEVEFIVACLFNPAYKFDKVLLLTPSLPDDFNFSDGFS